MGKSLGDVGEGRHPQPFSPPGLKPHCYPPGLHSPQQGLPGIWEEKELVFTSWQPPPKELSGWFFLATS